MDYCFTTRCRAWTIALLRGVTPRCRAWTIALLRGVEHGLLLYYEV